MKVYQMTQEQIDLLSNDLIEILQEISTVNKELQETTESNKQLLNESDLSKLNRVSNDITFIVNSVNLLKNDLLEDYNGVHLLFEDLKKQYEAIETLSKKLDKKYAHIHQFTPHKSGQSKWLLLFIGASVGISLMAGLFAFIYGDGFISQSINELVNIFKG
jgi:chromosome segregation ATPase